MSTGRRNSNEKSEMRSTQISIKKKKKYDKQDNFDSSLKQDSQLGLHGKEGDIHESFSLENFPHRNRKIFEELHSKQSTITVMLPQLLQANMHHSVNGAVV